jgi:peroxin-16
MNTYAVQKYNQWVRKNDKMVRGVEQGITLMATMIPGYVGGDSESTVSLLSEGAWGMSSLMTLYHDHVLSPKGLVEMKSFHSGPDNGFRDAPVVAVVRLLLTFFNHMEITLEIFGEKMGGVQGKWETIRMVESMKAALRIFLLSRVWGRKACVLCGGGQFISPMGEEATHAANGLQTPPPHQFYGRHSGRMLQLPPTRRRFKSSATATLDFQFVGELLHVLRPVCHVYAMKSYGIMSWKPWLMSLACDVISRSSTRTSRQQNFYEWRDLPGASAELTTRDRWLLLYLIRSPMFELTIKPFVQRLEGVPYIGGFFKMFISTFLMYYTQYYFYISGSN